MPVNEHEAHNYVIFSILLLLPLLGINTVFGILLSNTITLFSTPKAIDKGSQLYKTSQITGKYLDLNIVY